MMSGDGGVTAFDQGYLPAEDGHEVFWARFGNRQGAPALLVHGGPGSGMADEQLSLFDLTAFDVTTWDQRGCGRSRPFGKLGANNPDALVADMERLRQTLAIDRWDVVGGSWGTTLALSYAQRFPERVARLVLWGMWLFRPEDVQWHMHGARELMPEAWQVFADAVNYADGDDLLQCYAERVFDDRPAVHGPVAAAWKNFERQRRAPADWRDAELLVESRETTNMARTMIHYFLTSGRTGHVDLLSQADRLNGISGTVIHGRYDLITPFSGAHAICDAWAGGRLVECAGSGHTVDQPAIRDAVVNAIAGD